MNPTVILALISDLYNQNALLTEELQKRQAPEPLETQDGYKAYLCPDGSYCVSWGGQWLSGIYGKTAAEAIEHGRAEVAKG